MHGYNTNTFEETLTENQTCRMKRCSLLLRASGNENFTNVFFYLRVHIIL